MQSGHINQYAHLSKFKSAKEFNDSNKIFLNTHRQAFTKGEHIGLLTLIQYSVKIPGVCNAKICKLVQATHAKNKGISRTTFERMLKKGMILGLFTTYKTIRKKGGKSHNVYVFNHFDVSKSEKLTQRVIPQTPVTSSPLATKTVPESISLKSKKIKEKDLRKETLDSLDYTYAPSNIPTQFVKAVKPFFPSARDICALWDRAKIAYNARNYDQPIDEFSDIIIQAFKQTVYRHKRKQIKTGFMQYFYGVLVAMLPMGVRLSSEQRGFVSWLDRFDVETVIAIQGP
ncbi:hypothetical protein N0O92_23180 [Alkalihalobacillus sp. MEB130]|uniref:hypothetical protein n=1 Tax=Alkalihalobacillus sp. MEB130 TaxID=2976704 RepID=UPI0028DE8850|nr:hypothetical protein [Alkalihalobacillus sp. MEB130]MDT8863059.1 hypothetical protein [Alkalihalobacillus sp. MEB130]